MLLPPRLPAGARFLIGFMVMTEQANPIGAAADSTSPRLPGSPGDHHHWAGDLVTTALPWAISLVFHVLIFLLMFLIVWVVQVTKPVDDLPVSEARLTDYFDRPSATRPETPVVDSEQVVPIQQDTPTEHMDLLSEVALQNDSDIRIIGIGAGADAGDLNQFGLSAPALGEGPSFFGLGRGEKQARRICYVVDRSGSMVEELHYVKEEVRRSIEGLHRVQEYHVIFFSGGEPIEAPPGRFVHAIRGYKEQTFQFIDSIEAGGTTDPIQAMLRAIKKGADLIYFLTDGEFSEALIGKLRDHNRDGRVRIYTIAFIRRNGEDLLRRIARENNGEFRFVSEADLY